MAELAIILPLLALLTIGVVELGTAFFALNTLHKAARVGIRYINHLDDDDGTNPVLTPAQIQAQMDGKINLVMNGLPTFYTGSVTILPYTTTATAGINHHHITLTYNHQLILGSLLNNFSSFFGNTVSFTLIPLSATAHMREDA